MFLLKNKTALITGGARGIGEAIVRTFVRQGARVVFTYYSSQKKAELLVKALGEDKVKAISCDGTNSEEVSRAVREAVDFLGSIDILANNSGITKDQILLRMKEEEWDEVIHTNLKSVFLFSKAVCRYMLRKGGSIINTSSVMGIYGNPGQTNYAASKAGIIGFTKSFAQEYGSKNIRCNVIAPGWIQTDMTEQIPEEIRAKYTETISLQRIGLPQDVADTALFLASDLSSYITGQVIEVSGGIKR